MGKSRNFKNNRKNQKHSLKKGKEFWDDEYSNKDHLKISDNPSSDMIKFYRWLGRTDDYYLPYKGGSVLDIGCGNGRNIISTCKEFGCKGVGYDISSEAIEQCKLKAEEEGLDIAFHVQNASESIPLEDNSQKVVLDMMVSHVLKNEERKNLIKEVHRVLEDQGFLFLKTFLLDGDLNAKKLLKNHPGQEEGSYIHPKIGIEEHVYTHQQLEEDYEPYFDILKVYKSHKHLDKHGRANKRRSIMMYLQKKQI